MLRNKWCLSIPLVHRVHTQRTEFLSVWTQSQETPQDVGRRGHGEEEQTKAPRWAVLVQWICCAGQAWAVPWRLPQSQEHRDSLCPALLPVSCQTGIAWLMALAVWMTWKSSLHNFSYLFGIAFKIFFLWKAALVASLWSEMEILGKVTFSGDGNAARLLVLLEGCWKNSF